MPTSTEIKSLLILLRVIWFIIYKFQDFSQLYVNSFHVYTLTIQTHHCPASCVPSNLSNAGIFLVPGVQQWNFPGIHQYIDRNRTPVFTLLGFFASAVRQQWTRMTFLYTWTKLQTQKFAFPRPSSRVSTSSTFPTQPLILDQYACNQ